MKRLLIGLASGLIMCGGFAALSKESHPKCGSTINATTEAVISGTVKPLQMSWENYGACKVLTVHEGDRKVLLVGNEHGVAIHEGHWRIAIPWVVADEIGKLRPKQ